VRWRVVQRKPSQPESAARRANAPQVRQKQQRHGAPRPPPEVPAQAAQAAPEAERNRRGLYKEVACRYAQSQNGRR